MSHRPAESAASSGGADGSPDSQTPRLSELRDALAAALELTGEREASDADVEALLERAVRALDDYLGSESGEPDKDLLDEIRDVSREIEELLAHVDVEGVADAVSPENALDVVDPDNVPEAVTEGDVREALAYENVPDFVDWHDLADAVNPREFWRNKRELDREVDDVKDYVSGDGAEREADDADDAPPSLDARDAVASGALEPAEFERAAVQKRVGEGVDELRESLLDAHVQLRDRVEAADERTRRVGRPNSRNPTAVSTLPRSRPAGANPTRHSTVPTETLHSGAPNRARIYGPRFDEEIRRTDR